MLLVEDSEEDEALLLRELARAGYEVNHQRVDTEPAMRAALVGARWDLVISDYTMPTFSAIKALEVLHTSGQDLPFIICSGTIGEDAAVTALKAGGHDFVVKGRFARLQPAIERELREAAGREERRRAERGLRFSEEKYRRIVETSQEGIWTVDAEGKTTYVNRRMADLLAVPAEQMAGVSLFDFLDPDGPDTDPFSVVFARPEHAAQHELRFQRRDGSEFWASVSTTPVLDDGGQYAGSLSMVTDITERRKLHAQVMASDRMASVGTMAAGLAHEINNPLAAVVANIDLARAALDRLATGGGTGPDPALEEIAETLHDAQEATGRVRDIIRDVKIFSRADDEVTGPVDVRRVLDSSARMARTEIRHRAVLVRRYEPVPLVEGSESRLGQVFLNLMVNAAQAIPEGQVERNRIELRTSTEPGDGAALVEVRDTGAGMPPDVLKRLFTPFFTTKPPGLGTGLGLSICQRVVNAMHGEITVESHPGEGTVFRVRLPAAPSAVHPPPPSAPVRDRGARRAGRVLVVDDEPMIASALKRCLSAQHQVTVTHGAQDALDLIRRDGPYDVILCDLMMPQMTGMELHEQLARVAPESAARMVFLTGGAFTQRARVFLEEIPNARLDKPFDPTVLRALVNQRVG